MPGTHRHALDCEHAESFDHSRGVVVASGARPGHDDEEVAARDRLEDGAADAVRVVGLDGEHHGFATDLARPERPT